MTATSAPRIAGIWLVAISLGALALRGRSALVVRAALGVVTVILAIGAVLAHDHELTIRNEAIERPAKQALLGHTVPRLEWSHSFNVSGDSNTQLPSAGHIAVLDFWATWCSPCRLQMPKLEDLHKRRRELGIDVVGVTTFYGHDQSPEGRRRELQEIADFLQANGITYPVVVASSMANHDLFHVSALPTSVLIDRNGTVIDYGVGLEGSEVVTAHALAAAE